MRYHSGMFGFGKKTPAVSPAPATAPNTAPAAADSGGVRGFFRKLGARLGGGFLGGLLGRKIDADLLEELESRLLTADVGVAATQALLGDLHKQVARNELKDEAALLQALRVRMLALLSGTAKPLVLDPARHPNVVLVVGVNGSGKTTTIGKLARRYVREGRKVMLAAGDTFRAAAVEQLQTWADRNDVPCVAQATGADPAAVVFDGLAAAQARGMDVLLADTAGRLHVQTHLMEELKKVKRVLGKADPTAPHEVLLVLDGSQGQNALSQARTFHAALGVTGIVLTKLDGSAKGGILFALAQELSIPVRFVGLGGSIDDLAPFDAEAFVDGLLGTASMAGAGDTA